MCPFTKEDCTKENCKYRKAKKLPITDIGDQRFVKTEQSMIISVCIYKPMTDAHGFGFPCGEDPEFCFLNPNHIKI